MTDLASTEHTVAPPARRALASWWSRTPRSRRGIYISMAGFVLLTIVQTISGQHDLTSAFTMTSTIRLMLPIAMCGLGGLVAERSGIVNIGLEGMMILGTWGCGFLGYHWGPLGGLLGAMIGGAIGGLLHAVATVGFGVDHVVSGVAINLLASGWARFLAGSLFKGRGAGSETNSPGFDTHLFTLRVPGLGDGGAIARLEKHHWFFVSDLAGFVRGTLGTWRFEQLFAILLIPAIGWLVWRTRFGLRLRASGEQPSAPDSLGVNVYRIQYLALALSGALAGVGGALLVLDNNGVYQEGQTASRGFLGLSALIFGNWKPLGVLAGSALFGFFDAIQLTASGAVRGMYLVAAVAAVVGALIFWRRRRTAKAASSAAFAVGLVLLYLSKFKLNEDLVKSLPYFATLVVLAVFSRRLRPPAHAGRVWRKGQST
jgi:simple sugar transport system permease protein